ncbi:MAG: hypothetical protein KJ614_12580 [Gammaproteobacteria bacterium]|uniref:hypothetical protein n=1 Tax=Rhodoferax sp. TaxID=50421 RepID=UPI00181B3E15|nr:hypothetical protein [Rhodoferax sp.]MBU3899741.1 hypothetical protein [Gammaproteobacteria bacterium]MBA3058215.1 hypothetical protein [Rhodoferax sp.]MBU3997372.1 hypothetical protein [Gammaproteobacteria bacterium]MBU4018217.1 hypothetical protein [Gammaproteobacteria bacterium]MBU4080092.1 hypothetical protein [Gammaproteobacteria bacterium]
MKNFYLFLFLSVCAVGVWAQATPPRRGAATEQLPPDLRRSELREALKRMQASQAQETGPVVDAETLEPRRTYDRRLTEQERADLRQQLRQLNADDMLNVGAK